MDSVVKGFRKYKIVQPTLQHVIFYGGFSPLFIRIWQIARLASPPAYLLPCRRGRDLGFRMPSSFLPVMFCWIHGRVHSREGTISARSLKMT